MEHNPHSLPQGVRSLKVNAEPNGSIQSLRLVFGPGFFLEVERSEAGKTSFVLGFTHHGFKVDASIVGSELEEIIEEVRERRPERQVD